MSFAVHPEAHRRLSFIYCVATFAVSLVEVVLAFCALYWGKQWQGIVLLAWIFAIILSFLAWNAFEETRRCLEQVAILPDEERVTLRSPTGKEVRTFHFAEIQDVRIVKLPMLTGVGRAAKVRWDSYICVTSGLSENCCTDVRSNPNCIVFAYNASAEQMLHALGFPQATGRAD